MGVESYERRLRDGYICRMGLIMWTDSHARDVWGERGFVARAITRGDVWWPNVKFDSNLTYCVGGAFVIYQLPRK